MTTLNDILVLIPMEDQWTYVFDTEGTNTMKDSKGIWSSAKKENLKEEGEK